MNPFFLIVGAAVATVLLVALRPALKFTLSRIAHDNWWYKQPSSIRFKPLLMPGWAEPERVEALANPLLLLGFIDIGTFSVVERPGEKIRFLLNEAEAVAAFIHEYPHARTRVFIEFSVRYQDGTTTALVNIPATTVDDVPFFRAIHVDADTPSADMYRRILSERSPTGIKPVTRDAVIPEYQLAYSKIVVGKKNPGLSAEEVARIAAKLAR